VSAGQSSPSPALNDAQVVSRLPLGDNTITDSACFRLLPKKHQNAATSHSLGLELHQKTLARALQYYLPSRKERLPAQTTIKQPSK